MNYIIYNKDNKIKCYTITYKMTEMIQHLLEIKNQNY